MIESLIVGDKIKRDYFSTISISFGKIVSISIKKGKRWGEG
jgi:hypothetical protein